MIELSKELKDKLASAGVVFIGGCILIGLVLGGLDLLKVASIVPYASIPVYDWGVLLGIFIVAVVLSEIVWWLDSSFKPDSTKEYWKCKHCKTGRDSKKSEEYHEKYYCGKEGRTYCVIVKGVRKVNESPFWFTVQWKTILIAIAFLFSYGLFKLRKVVDWLTPHLTSLAWLALIVIVLIGFYWLNSLKFKRKKKT